MTTSKYRAVSDYPGYFQSIPPEGFEIHKKIARSDSATKIYERVIGAAKR